MPQLNPNPWFYIMFLVWMVILTIMPPKISALKHLSDPSNDLLKLTSTKHWAWPWT